MPVTPFELEESFFGKKELSLETMVQYTDERLRDKYTSPPQPIKVTFYGYITAVVRAQFIGLYQVAGWEIKMEDDLPARGRSCHHVYFTFFPKER